MSLCAWLLQSDDIGEKPVECDNMWCEITCDNVNSQKQLQLWGAFSDYNQEGHDCICCLEDAWMLGYHGLFDGCNLKKCTNACIRMCEEMLMDSVFIPTHTYVYIDGSSQCVGLVDVMSWALAVFEVDGRMVHKCI